MGTALRSPPCSACGMELAGGRCTRRQQGGVVVCYASVATNASYRRSCASVGLTFLPSSPRPPGIWRCGGGGAPRGCASRCSPPPPCAAAKKSERRRVHVMQGSLAAHSRSSSRNRVMYSCAHSEVGGTAASLPPFAAPPSASRMAASIASSDMAPATRRQQRQWRGRTPLFTPHSAFTASRLRRCRGRECGGAYSHHQSEQ